MQTIAETTTGLKDGMNAFLGYLGDFRGCSKDTIRCYRRDLGYFLGFLEGTCEGVPQPHEVTKEHVMRWLVTFRGLSPRTIRHRLACLSSCYTFLVDMGMADRNPVHGIALPRIPETHREPLSADELFQLLAVAEKPWQHCAITLLATAGLRRAELAELTLDRVDLDAAVIHVHGKGGKERTLPLGPAALRAVRLYLATRRAMPGEDHLLVNVYGTALGQQAVWKAVKGLAKQAGIEKRVHPHLFRHGYACGLVSSGADLRTVQDLLGHASLQTTALYLHPSEKGKRIAVEALERALVGAR